jgi:hypothetical protein
MQGPFTHPSDSQQGRRAGVWRARWYTLVPTGGHDLSGNTCLPLTLADTGASSSSLLTSWWNTVG